MNVSHLLNVRGNESNRLPPQLHTGGYLVGRIRASKEGSLREPFGLCEHLYAFVGLVGQVVALVGYVHFSYLSFTDMLPAQLEWPAL